MFDVEEKINRMLGKEINKDKGSKNKMSQWVCKDCGQKYTTDGNKKPQPMKWKDGHTCSLIPLGQWDGNIKPKFR